MTTTADTPGVGGVLARRRARGRGDGDDREVDVLRDVGEPRERADTVDRGDLGVHTKRRP